MKYERLTKETVGSFGYDLKDFEHKPKEFNDYDAFFAYKMAVKRLGELEDKIERGELVSTVRDELNMTDEEFDEEVKTARKKSKRREEMKYERLTTKCEVGIGLTETSGNIVNDYEKVVNRLAELEDKIESGELDYVADRDKQIARLTAENAELRATLSKMETVEKELRARLEKAVELPVKVGDTVYFIPTYNGKPIWGVQRGIVQMVGITRQGYHVKIRDRADFNKTYMFRKSAFLSKEQAEARLAELKGGEKNG